PRRPPDRPLLPFHLPLRSRSADPRRRARSRREAPLAAHPHRLLLQRPVLPVPRALGPATVLGRALAAAHQVRAPHRPLPLPLAMALAGSAARQAVADPEHPGASGTGALGPPCE